MLLVKAFPWYILLFYSVFFSHFLELISSKVDLVSRDTGRFSNHCSSHGGVGERHHLHRTGEILEADATNRRNLSKKLECTWCLALEREGRQKWLVVGVERLGMLTYLTGVTGVAERSPVFQNSTIDQFYFMISRLKTWGSTMYCRAGRHSPWTANSQCWTLWSQSWELRSKKSMFSKTLKPGICCGLRRRNRDW